MFLVREYYLEAYQGLPRFSSFDQTKIIIFHIQKYFIQLIKFGFKWIFNIFKSSPLIKSPVESPLWAQQPKNRQVFGLQMNWSRQLVFREAYQQPLFKIEMG